MSEKTITRADLSEVLYERVGLSRSESSDLVDSVLDLMTDAIVDDGGLKLSGFGSFSLREKSERIGRNPKTGEEAVITPRRVVTFKASHILKNRINDGV